MSLMTSQRLGGPCLDGKVALITGGSKGIGLATAQLCVKLGAKVVICSRGLKSLKTAKTSMSDPSKCETISADLSTKAGIDELANAYPLEHLDILVNNVGTNIRKRAEEFSQEEFQTIFATNIFSAYNIALAFLPRLKKSASAAIVNISSVAGVSHIPSGCAYGATKAALDQLTRNLSVEWSRFGIRVNSVAPGPIGTPLMEGANKTYLSEFTKRIPLRRFGRPEEVANTIVFLGSDLASYITGQSLMVDGGFTATSYNEVPEFWREEESLQKKQETDA